MARYFNGTAFAVGLGGNAATLLSGRTEFTIAAWVRPDTLTPGADKHVLLAIDSGGDYWSLQYTTSGEIAFVCEGYGGSNPTASATTAAFSDIDIAHGKRVLYRYDGTVWEVWTGSRTGGLTKKTINASITFSLPTISSGTYLGFDGVSEFFEGALAEIAAWNIALSDYDAEQVLRGVACDQIADASLVAYWPLRGTRSAEPDYVELPAIGGSAALSVSGATAEAHPPVTGLDEIAAPEAAWCLDLQHADGTLYAASMDLAQPVDVDVLGRTYPARIANAESVFVSKSINDGIVSPGSTTVILQNNTALSPADTAAGGLACWLEADQIRDADDGDTVTLWPDVSGRGLDAEQYSSSGPTYDADGINGLPALLFDADTESLDLVSRCPTDGTAPYTIVTVFTRTDTDTGTHAALSGVGSGWILYTASGSVKLDMGSTLTLGSVKAINTPYVVSYVCTGNGNAGFARVDQGTWQTATATAHPGSNIVVGTNNGPGLHLDGRVAAVLVYDRALGEDELRRVENYLAAKYACTAIDHGAVLPRREWRGVRAILRRYERTSHELVTELIAKVDSVDWSRYGRVALTLTGAGSDVLDTRIPKALVNVDEHESATDLLAPIPMLFGSGWVSAPYIGHDESTSPGTADFAVCHAEDADSVARDIQVTRVLFDIVPGFPGLEEATSWYEAGGTTPTRVSNTVMQLSDDFEVFYEPGMPVRITVAGTPYYTTVASYDNGTDRVTVVDPVVTNNPTKVEVLAGGYLVQSGEYTSGGADITSVRFVGTGFGGGVVVEATGDLTNPSDVIAEILRNGIAGLGESIDSALFAQAATDYTAAGLGAACQYALGGDRQQRAARSVLAEILALRGAWLDLQPDGSWGIYVDKLPAWSQLRAYGVGSPRFSPIERVTAHTVTPLSQQVGTLKLRYRKKGRSRSNEGVTSWAAPSDYEFQNNYTVSTVGADRVVTNPWLDRATVAGKVVVYQGKRLKYEDEKLAFILGFRGRNIALGEILRLCLPASQVDGDYRVVSLNRGLRQTTVGTVGYSADIFAFDAGEVEYDAASGTNTSTDTSDTGTGPGKAIMGPNLIPNSGFAATSGSFSPISGGSGTDTTYLGGNSGWTIAEGESSVTDIAAVSVTDSDSWIGGRYLNVQLNSVTGDPHIRTRVTIEPSKPHLAAVYLGKSGVSDPSDVRGWKAIVRYYTALGSQTGSDYEPTLRATGETTGDGTARRWFFGFTPPSAARYAILFLYFTATGTFRVAAASINQSDRFAFLPPPWQNTALRS